MAYTPKTYWSHFCIISCLIGIRKSTWPVKWGNELLALLHIQRGASVCIWSTWCHCHPIVFYFIKILNSLPFWCWLMQIILEKKPLNRCLSWVCDVWTVRMWSLLNLFVFSLFYHLEKLDVMCTYKLYCFVCWSGAVLLDLCDLLRTYRTMFVAFCHHTCMVIQGLYKPLAKVMQ